MVFYDKLDFTLRYIGSFITDFGKDMGKSSSFLNALLEVRTDLDYLKEEISLRKKSGNPSASGGQGLVTKIWVASLARKIAILQLTINESKMMYISDPALVVDENKRFNYRIEQVVGLLQLLFETF